jgi:hypothetical protein
MSTPLALRKAGMYGKMPCLEKGQMDVVDLEL